MPITPCRLRFAAARLAAACLAAAALTGCPDDAPDPPDAEAPHLFVGDPEQDLQIEILALRVGAGSAPVAEGDTVDVIMPPQGGRVVFAGVRATNLDVKGAQISGAIRDPESMHLMLDARTVNLEPTDDGWAASVDEDISTFSNVPVCPNQWSSKDIFDQDYELVMTVTDKGGRTATQTVTVRPMCAEPDLLQDCLCICKQGYVLGEPCP
jgi:hypothetical protein